MEDTEWNDILRQKGILPPLDPNSAKPDPIFIQSKYRKEDDDEDDDELLDELENEDDFFKQYRQKRLDELQSQQQNGIEDIGKEAFMEKVTLQSQNCWVFCLLYQPKYITNLTLSHDQCMIILKHLEELHKRHPEWKFVKVISNECIENYPNHLLPTLLAYGNGDLQEQFLKVEDLGADWLEERLVALIKSK